MRAAPSAVRADKRPTSRSRATSTTRTATGTSTTTTRPAASRGSTMATAAGPTRAEPLRRTLWARTPRKRGKPAIRGRRAPAGAEAGGASPVIQEVGVGTAAGGAGVGAEEGGAAEGAAAVSADSAGAGNGIPLSPGLVAREKRQTDA